MTLYAWKITAPGQPGIESISTLDDLERFMGGLGLSGRRPPREIIDRTVIMEHEGQGFYRNDVGGSQWMLSWIKLGESRQAANGLVNTLAEDRLWKKN